MKYAAFTMDLEGLSDAECIAKRGLPVSDELFDGLEHYLNLLEAHGARATLFTLCSAPHSLDETLRAALSRGHRLALHGLRHTAPLHLSTQEFSEQIARAKSELEQRFDCRIYGYRAPFFSLDRPRLDILRAQGFAYDSSLGYAHARHTAALDLSGFTKHGSGVWSDGEFSELAPSQGRLFGGHFPVSGGGYARICPWFVMKPALRRYLKTHDRFIFYLHPFELSQKSVGTLRGLKFYDRIYLRWGRRRFSARLERIFRLLRREGFETTTLEELSDSLRG